MKFSVIVPVYGVEKYIARCAESLLNQHYADKELIFVDDASPDDSMTILQKVLSRYSAQHVTILHHTINQGLAAARKTGMKAATGEYIVHVDSDDYLEPDALDILAQKAQETDADIIGMDFYFDWGERRKVYKGRWSENAQEYGRLILSGATMPNMWAHVMRRQLVVQSGIEPIVGLDTGEDYLFVSKLCNYAHRVAHVERPLYHYMQTNNASYMHVLSEKNIRSLTRVMNELSAFYADKKEFIDALRAGQWLKKTELMMRVHRSQYPLADEMPAALPIDHSTMTHAQRLAAPLVAKRHWLALSIYSRWYRALNELVQVVKGRRKTC